MCMKDSGVNKVVSRVGIKFMPINKWIGGARFIETLIPAVGLLLVAIAIATESVLRFFFSFAILGLEEATVVAGVYVYYIGSANASRDGAQIRISLIEAIPLRSGVRRTLDLIVGFLSFTVCFIFTYYAFDYAWWTVTAGITIEPLGWPMLVIAFSLVLGLGLMGLHHLEQFVRTLQKV